MVYKFRMLNMQQAEISDFDRSTRKIIVRNLYGLKMVSSTNL